MSVSNESRRLSSTRVGAGCPAGAAPAAAPEPELLLRPCEICRCGEGGPPKLLLKTLLRAPAPAPVGLEGRMLSPKD